MTPFKFDFFWKTVKNKYGSLLAFEPPKFFDGMATLSYQSNITKLLESGDYNYFVDVGAAWGYFPRIASKHCKKVWAYEANPIRFGFLLHNTRDLENVECFYNYVGSKKSVPKMDNALQMIKKSSNQTYNVKTITLDDALYKILCRYKTNVLIKMDIEGAELDALAGAEKLLELKNVHWSIDVHTKQGVSVEQVLKFFGDRERKNVGLNVTII